MSVYIPQALFWGSLERDALRQKVSAPRESEFLLQQAVLAPATLDRMLSVVDARLRSQTQVSRPRIKELRRAMALLDREIANYTRAIAKGDFSSLEHALAAAS